MLKDNLNYGVIGNCRSAALVSNTGDIEWCCLPNFNSQAVFANILDEKKGGRFAIEPKGDYQIRQEYIRNTNVLVTNFYHAEHEFEVVDFMPRYKTEKAEYHNPPEIIRFIRLIRGEPVFRVVYEPKLNYGANHSRINMHKDYIKCYTQKGTYESVYLYSNLNKSDIIKGGYIGLKKDAFLLLSYNQKIIIPDLDYVNLEMERTKVYWMNWVDKIPVLRKYKNEVIRSSLILKLLTYQKTGAILAAITTSLPETIGEVRNWDYRYCWIRDSSMIVNTLTTMGHFNAARRFMNFILDVVPHKDERIQIMYGINGEKKLTEKELDHLSGYMGSKPVRIGNAAYLQKQNDIYGVLMDVLYQHIKNFRSPVDVIEDLWTISRSIVKLVKNNWTKPDMGIWEFRTMKRHYTFSKVLCWVAVDRGVKIARHLRKRNHVREWEALRERIRKNILKYGWSNDVGAFTQSYGTNDLDAANLLMNRFGFLDSHDEKFISTVKVTRNKLSKDGLMFRYKNADDFGEPSSSFTICTFWLIEALYAIGEKKEATQMFDQILSYSNHLGLFSEDIDFKTKRLLGNFPQGYSHLALIDTAITLSGIKQPGKMKMGKF